MEVLPIVEGMQTLSLKGFAEAIHHASILACAIPCNKHFDGNVPTNIGFKIFAIQAIG